jgi:hypothetical protein
LDRTGSAKPHACCSSSSLVCTNNEPLLPRLHNSQSRGTLDRLTDSLDLSYPPAPSGKAHTPVAAPAGGPPPHAEGGDSRDSQVLIQVQPVHIPRETPPSLIAPSGEWQDQGLHMRGCEVNSITLHAVPTAPCLQGPQTIDGRQGANAAGLVSAPVLNQRNHHARHNDDQYSTSLPSCAPPTPPC